MSNEEFSKEQKDKAVEYFRSGVIIPMIKPYSWTSFNLVNKVRWQLCRSLGIKKLKVGHAGTLDPLATGVVVLCVGKATKKIQEIQNTKKEYLATLKLGEVTPSYDLETEVSEVRSIAHITEDAINKVLENYVGELLQEPPLFSAVKVQGDRAYKLAREGLNVKLLPKRVTIYSIECVSCDLPKVVLKVTCGKGTYIRALARDIGEDLDCGAHLTALERVAVGDYTLQRSVSVDAFKKQLEEKILSL